MYKVTHKNSAVSSKCSDVFILIVMLENSIKNKSIVKLISPNDINYIKFDVILAPIEDFVTALHTEGFKFLRSVGTMTSRSVDEVVSQKPYKIQICAIKK